MIVFETLLGLLVLTSVSKWSLIILVPDPDGSESARARGSTVTSCRSRPQQEEATIVDRKSGDVTY